VLKKLLEQLGKVTPFGVDIENAVEHQDHCLPSRREKSCAHFRQFFMGPLKNVFQETAQDRCWNGVAVASA
jgi:hypothetical protein